jgi:hypothetical protein
MTDDIYDALSATLQTILQDSDLVEDMENICGIEVFVSSRSSVIGKAFARDCRDAGDFYWLLDDGSIGFYGCEGICGRIAESLRDFFALTLNCPNWYAYATFEYMNAPELLARDVARDIAAEKCKDKEFVGIAQMKVAAWANIAEKLKLKISQDITKDILPAFYSAATREPLFSLPDSKDGSPRPTNIMR